MLDNIKKVVILGGGESGCGSAILAKKQGFEVLLSDNGELIEKYRLILEDYKVEYEHMGHTVEKIINADLVIKSPGIPDTVELIKKLISKGVRVISELEFAKYYTNAKTICITGSNGKTTTATLIYNILKDAGYNVGLGGNIGKSFAMQVATQSFDWYVLEISSFQLDGMFDFRADISILTNITPDHLDRYDYKMENYVHSKFRIANNQTKLDSFIYCGDDLQIIKHKNSIGIDAMEFSYSVKTLNHSAILKNDFIVVKINGEELNIYIDELQIKGLHNISNTMACILATMLAGVDSDSIKNSIRGFTGVEHRVEHICCLNDIVYINDSKATNVDAVWYALESLTRPVVWIAGGTDKGNDYSQLTDLVQQKVHTLICLGLDNEKLIKAFGGIVDNIYDTSCLEDAIIAVGQSANSGDVVILSPACASFDLFNNYENRGELFKEAILNLTR